MRRGLVAVACALVALSGCVIEGAVGSTRPLVFADSASADRVAVEPDVRSMDASDEDSAARDAGAEVLLVDVRITETGGPEAPLCGPAGECPLARYCSRTLCQAPFSGCDEDEKCNGLDDDCDGVADNGIDCGSGDPCPDGGVRCGGECVDIARSMAHCGRCDRPCALARCDNGFCQSP